MQHSSNRSDNFLEEGLLANLRALSLERKKELLDFSEFLKQRERFIAHVDEGLRDSDAGRVIDDSQLGAELDAEFGSIHSA